eukprot:COSAG01_NODE_6824_length_3482_cov_5.154597_1_plen_281_part_00
MPTPEPIGLGDLQDIELLVYICGFSAPRDLGRLARVSASFGRKTAWQRSAVHGGGTELRSVVEETARRWVVARPMEEQTRVAAQCLGWLWRMNEIQTPAAILSRSGSSIKLSQRRNGSTIYSWATKTSGNDIRWGRSNQGYEPVAAASAVAMRGGRHYAEFGLGGSPSVRRCSVYFGLIRPSCDVEDPESGHVHMMSDHHFYNTRGGPDRFGRCKWEGIQGASKGDTIGLLLDLEVGTVTVFKNGKRLGVMATGLEGSYCWAVVFCYQGCSACIHSASVP